MNPAARRTNIFTEHLGSEVVLYDQTTHKAHRLNTTTAAVWDNADGDHSLDDLAGILAEKFSMPRNPDFVLLAIEQLNDAGLMETLASPAASKEPSRRDATRRLAMAGVSASLLPFVASIVAPTPAMASSPAHTYSAQDVEQDLSTVETDIANNLGGYIKSSTAQQDLGAGINSLDQGLAQTLQGRTAAAQTDFQAAVSDFDGVLKALGLPPL